MSFQFKAVAKKSFTNGEVGIWTDTIGVLEEGKRYHVTIEEIPLEASPSRNKNEEHALLWCKKISTGQESTWVCMKPLGPFGLRYFIVNGEWFESRSLHRDKQIKKAALETQKRLKKVIDELWDICE